MVDLARWNLESLEIAGGFLADLSLRFPPGLVCVIGPRGSGKSTLAEAVRFVVGGLPTSASKVRLELIKATLGAAIFTLKTASDTDREGYTVRRTYGQTANLTTGDNRSITTVDLDRGTFLPLDAYSSLEIEAIADESLGNKRRSLLDELCTAEMQRIQLTLADLRRALEANADSIVAAHRQIADFTEQIEELGDVRARLKALPPMGDDLATPEFQKADRQRRSNKRENNAIAQALDALSVFRNDLLEAIARARSNLPDNLVVSESANVGLLSWSEATFTKLLWHEIERGIDIAEQATAATAAEIEAAREKLREVHATQEREFLDLQQKHRAVAQAMENRSAAERDVTIVDGLNKKRLEAQEVLRQQQGHRKELRAEYLLTRDQIAEQREAVAERLQREAGRKVRIRVQRNADTLEYQEQLLSALRGSRLRNQETILSALAQFRPEQLAQILVENDLDELEAQAHFGKERTRKILSALQENLDPLELEVLAIEDRICIELNVGPVNEPNFKDAAELSRGQKCTALLPILLARRDTPLIIDQPEDNLDNHFIYETVVESIRRLRTRRQMIFITHNANIPVLGEADLVVVLNSDGKRGYVEKAGSVNECRREIIDLLEGGEEAFELRRQRYAT